jgi:hypothetical protein
MAGRNSSSCLHEPRKTKLLSWKVKARFVIKYFTDGTGMGGTCQLNQAEDSVTEQLPVGSGLWPTVVSFNLRARCSGTAVLVQRAEEFCKVQIPGPRLQQQAGPKACSGSPTSDPPASKLIRDRAGTVGASDKSGIVRANSDQSAGCKVIDLTPCRRRFVRRVDEQLNYKARSSINATDLGGVQRQPTNL